ncbi:hypothetical protein HID58_079339 [Brassica napus]|uniref:BnaC08g02700D protein n=2 Tax=Brassica napus TaxID=3708 RepID=A0A078H7K1_BRANA|nr:hypothetical protein HID58_079339 [Brassica napus]CAF2105814.1 unnamed protein product [Brassica napus]CDY32848.1 BnaC08g02700D [Brassica napus]
MKTVVVRFADADAAADVAEYYITTAGFIGVSRRTRRSDAASKHLTLEALESAVVAKFKSLRHETVWKKERPPSLKGDNELRVHRIHPLGLTQRQALYKFKFEGNSSLSTHVQHNPCAKFEGRRLRESPASPSVLTVTSPPPEFALRDGLSKIRSTRRCPSLSRRLGWALCSGSP